MKRQVSIKVYMDEDLYDFYKSIQDGKKGQVVRESLMLFRDINKYSSGKTVVEILAEINKGFEMLNSTIQRNKDIPNARQSKESSGESSKGGLSEMMDGFVEGFGVV